MLRSALSMFSKTSMFLLLLNLAHPGWARQQTAYDELLHPKGSYVQGQVRFWEDIFYKYPSTSVVIHDSFYPDRIVDVVDFKKIAKEKKIKRELSRSEKNSLVRKYIKRYELAVSRFKKLGKKALKYGEIEKRLYSVYSSSYGKSLLYRGKVDLRSQTGLADSFVEAADRAQDFLPHMENIFSKHNVPVELTRIAFVESMFNTHARSKVGASGIWQFMPRTAKRFMYVNRLVDERHSPLKAAEGAARLLKDNFSTLKSWPLAVTAYNHGKAGMSRAARKVGSNSIDMIAKYYKSRSFGFASRNFYAEFVAAYKVYKRIMAEGLVQKRPSKLQVEKVILPKRLSVSQIIRYTPLRSKTLADLNMCINKRTFTSYKNYRLPKNFSIFVPKDKAREVKRSLAQL